MQPLIGAMRLPALRRVTCLCILEGRVWTRTVQWGRQAAVDGDALRLPGCLPARQLCPERGRRASIEAPCRIKIDKRESFSHKECGWNGLLEKTCSNALSIPCQPTHPKRLRLSARTHLCPAKIGPMLCCIRSGCAGLPRCSSECAACRRILDEHGWFQGFTQLVALVRPARRGSITTTLHLDWTLTSSASIRYSSQVSLRSEPDSTALGG